MSRHHLLLGAVLAAPLLLPSAASAATTIGAAPEIAGEQTPLVGCAPAAACSIAQERYANEDLRVREAGVVVRWRLHGVDGQARLRRVGGGATPLAALPATPGIVEVPVQLPVAAGDLLALDLFDGARIGREPDPLELGAYVARTWTPALSDGESRAPSATAEAYWMFQAVIEPDRDGDGLGDETQDPDGGVIVQPPPPPGPPPFDPPPVDPPRREILPPDPYAALPRAGPAVKLPGRATATRSGVVLVALANPYDFRLDGGATLRLGRKKVSSAKLSLAAGESRTVTLKLSKPAVRTLARKRALKLSFDVSLRAVVGKQRTSRRTLTVKLGAAPRRAPTRPTRRGGGSPDAGFDGTYRAPDGQVMVVENGRVLSFSGTLTTYCTRTSKQKNVAYGMFGDDPDPVVAADGSFSYEATRGYGFIKLKFDGRIKGDVASGRMAVEDRSPLLGTGRFEFDYCFAGKEWTLTR